MGCKYVNALLAGIVSLYLAVKLAWGSPRYKVFCSDMTVVVTVNSVVYESGVQGKFDELREM